MNGRVKYALPESMDDVVGAVGLSAALALVHVFAGTRVYVPRPDRLEPHHPVAELLGFDLAHRLCQALGGTAWSVPACERMLNERRADQITLRVSQGATIAELAAAYAISERAVYDILARARTKRTEELQHD